MPPVYLEKGNVLPVNRPFYTKIKEVPPLGAFDCGDNSARATHLTDKAQ
jgi:hypothetical protein